MTSGQRSDFDKVLLSAVRAVPKTSGVSRNGVKNSREKKLCGRYPVALTTARKKLEVNPKRGGLYEPKREIRPLPDAEDESAAGATLSGSGSRSLAGFIENAINFYLNYLSANNAGMFLPSSVQSYLDGRLDQMEKRVAALLYKQSVELDMGMSILADCVNLDEAYLRKKSAESAARVKKLNGHLQLEQMAKRAQEQRDSDDGWQD